MKVGKVLVKIMLTAFILFIAFVIWDNFRIKITEQDITLEDLPKELEGFTVLQITDLHERYFGNDQKRLLEEINQLDYDVLVFTGDMMKSGESRNYQPFYSVLEGLEDKESVLVVAGNDDPPSYQFTPEFDKSEYIKGIEKRGGHFLESVSTIKKNGKSIHFVNFELSIVEEPDIIGQVNGSFQEPHASDERYKKYQTELWKEMIQGPVFQSKDVVIGVNHFPIPDQRADFIQSDSDTSWPDVDLIIAGHYHGGQIRIPFYGALFIPDPWYEPNSFFPPQDRVKGLWEYKGTKQYVSTGLGNSEALPFLNFRLFNPPEINVITLKSK